MSLFTGIDDTPSDKFGVLVSVETFTQLTTNLNYLVDSMPIGSKVPILIGLVGVPTPDPTIWMPCEGGTVDDQTSKLHDQTVPDDRGLFPKGATNIGSAGLTGGSNTNSWPHAHSGRTQDYDVGDDNGDTDDDYITVNKLHSHGIFSDLVGPYNIEPVHIRVRFYIKVR